jgi:hypothetical protein
MARPLTSDEGYNIRLQGLISKSLSQGIESVTKEMGDNRNKALRYLIDIGLKQHKGGLNDRKIPILGSAACGPFREAVDEPRFLNMGEVYNIMGLKHGDFGIQADGVSMQSGCKNDIPDGSIVIFRPNIQPQGKIVLASAKTEDGTHYWTIKRWAWDEEGFSLKDGKKRKIAIPADAVHIQASGVMVGIIPRINK